MECVDTPSPNCDRRRLPVSMIVLHCTGGDDADSALRRLCDPDSGRSVHYLVRPDGRVHALVAEDRRAWHAGDAHWRGIADVDGAAVAIALAHPGATDGFHPFPAEQMDAAVRLIHAVKERHAVTRGNVVGHSDVAPATATDPGEWFPWSMLARRRLALPRPRRNLIDPEWSDGGFLLALERFGYAVGDVDAAVRAFQRRFRPERIDGVIDAECRMILLALLLPRPQGED